MKIHDILQPTRQWLSVEEAAKILDKSEWTVRDLIRHGKLEARQRDGKSKEISRQSINLFIAGL